MLDEEILKIYQAGPEAVIYLIRQLEARIKALEDRLSKDSHNSSKPPSSDPAYTRKRRSKRKNGGKRSGGQIGHKGKNLEMTRDPDKVEKLKVFECGGCGRSLRNIPAIAYERRQVVDIKPIEKEITEYQAQKKECPYCEKLNTAVFPHGVKNNVQYGSIIKSIAVYLRGYQYITLERGIELFRDIFGINLCEGTLVNTSSQCAMELKDQGFIEWIKNQLINSPVVNFDETGINIGGKLHWLHNASTPFLTYYYPHPKRGKEAFDEIGILPDFTGKAVHDHWKAYFRYDCIHALCNSHHIRELTFIHEEENQDWAKEMIDLLLLIKENVESEALKGKLIDTYLMKTYAKRYKSILRKGFKINSPPIEDKVRKRGRKRKTKSLNLLERLQDYQKETLAFMYDLNVPFDNNQAERDIRMAKLQQKISGLFRSIDGALVFCTIRSFISTVRKQGLNIIDALKQVFDGQSVVKQFCLQ